MAKENLKRTKESSNLSEASVTSPLRIKPIDLHFRGQKPENKQIRRSSPRLEDIPMKRSTELKVASKSVLSYFKAVRDCHPDKQKAKIKIVPRSSSLSLCKICMDKKPTLEMFKSNKCTHSFCKDCICQHLAVKVQENIIKVKCPDLQCDAILEPEDCKSIMPEQLFDRWENALCESLILPSQKFYCPFKDCSAMLVDDGGEAVTASECPNCHRLFCAQCKVPWHAEMKCEEFQKSKKHAREKECDDMLQQLAKNKRWQRCPKCNFYVEKTHGCNSMKCRCGYNFCYRCGLEGSYTHQCRG